MFANNRRYKMSTFKQMVENYEKEYEKFVAMGLSENDALALVTKHIRDGKKPQIDAPENKKCKYACEEQPKKEESKKVDLKKEETPKEVVKHSFDNWFDSWFEINYDNWYDKFFKEFNKSLNNFWNPITTPNEEKKEEQPKAIQPKAEPREENKEVADIKSELNKLIKSGDKVKVISDKPNHIEYEVNKPNGSYYKYCYKIF